MDNIWKELSDFAAFKGLDTIETTLLGEVPWAKDESGRRVALIQPSLAQQARRHGFEIVSADWKRNCYTLRLMPSTPTP